MIKSAKHRIAEAGSSQEADSCYEGGNGRVQVAFIEHLRGVGVLQHSSIVSVACQTTQAFDCLKLLNMLNCASRLSQPHMPGKWSWLAFQSQCTEHACREDSMGCCRCEQSQNKACSAEAAHQNHADTHRDPQHCGDEGNLSGLPGLVMTGEV